MFKRWPSIENTYRQKELYWWVSKFPELETETYVITEKLHGSNFQWYFQPGKHVQPGSRNNFLDTIATFNGASIAELMAANANLLAMMQDSVDSSNCTIRLFGELVGPKIQNGVYYGEEKCLFYFGMMVDDVLLPFYEFEAAIGDDFHESIVPIVGEARGLQAALNFNPEFISLVTPRPVDNNTCEGIVIQPYNKVYASEQGRVFILKNKNETFKEKQHAQKERVVDTEVEYLNEEFKSYITDTRLQAVFSKHGEIERPQQIGEYIRLVLADAQEDFLKDFGDGFNVMDKSQQKQVFNVGGMIANMLKRYL